MLLLAGSTSLAPSSSRPPTGGATEQPLSRRASLGALWTVAGSGGLWLAAPAADAAQDTAIADAKQFVKTSYPDFTKTYAGWSYREVTAGKTGSTRAATGDRVIFALHNWTLGGPFKQKEGPRAVPLIKIWTMNAPVLGSGKMVAGVEQALTGMSAGAVRQVLVPFDERALSYPQATDPDHVIVGPKPYTFSGIRALNFVLDNPRLDRTLLFNVKVIRVDKPDGKGGFVRG